MLVELHSIKNLILTGPFIKIDNVLSDNQNIYNISELYEIFFNVINNMANQYI